MLFIIDTPARKKAAANYVAALSGSPMMQVEVKPYKRDRSLAQNRTYWMWVKPIADHTGNTADELHRILKVRFLGTVQTMVDGHCIIEPRSTTDLTVDEFVGFLNKVLELANSMDIKLPMPDDFRYAMKAD